MSTVHAQELLGHRLDELLDAIAEDASPAASGSIAAYIVAAAAALVSMAARRAPEWPSSLAVVAQAELLRTRAAALVQTDARVLADARGLLSGSGPVSADDRLELGDALVLAGFIPLCIAHVAADVAELAREAAEHPGAARADAAAAAALAHGAARAAAHLVAINLAARPGDDNVVTAHALADAAGRSAAAALATEGGS